MLPNYYATLGVAPSSPAADIRAAYLELMRRYHPDSNPSAAASSRVRDITAAYAVIGAPDKRAAYDRQRINWELAHNLMFAAPSHRRVNLFVSASLGIAVIALIVLLPPLVSEPFTNIEQFIIDANADHPQDLAFGPAMARAGSEDSPDTHNGDKIVTYAVANDADKLTVARHRPVESRSVESIRPAAPPLRSSTQRSEPLERRSSAGLLATTIAPTKLSEGNARSPQTHANIRPSEPPGEEGRAPQSPQSDEPVGKDSSSTAEPPWLRPLPPVEPAWLRPLPPVSSAAVASPR